jgi:hypothetical protein
MWESYAWHHRECSALYSQVTENVSFTITIWRKLQDSRNILEKYKLVGDDWIDQSRNLVKHIGGHVAELSLQSGNVSRENNSGETFHLQNEPHFTPYAEKKCTFWLGEASNWRWISSIRNQYELNFIVLHLMRFDFSGNVQGF